MKCEASPGQIPGCRGDMLQASDHRVKLFTADISELVHLSRNTTERSQAVMIHPHEKY